MIGLEHVLDYRFKTRGPFGDTDGSPRGAREYWEMSSGELSGEGISAHLVAPGGDWMTVSTDRFARPDVRVQLETDDGALILMHYRGLVERSDAFVAAAEADRPSSSTGSTESPELVGAELVERIDLEVEGLVG